MNIIEVRVAGRFKLGSKIASGTFCEIYQGTNVHSNQEVAIKLEDIKCKYPQLLYEAKILQNLQGGLSIPTLHWCGPENEYNVLVLDLLGQTLEELFILCERKFKLKTVLMIADQLITNIEFIHSRNYLHRDIKPENFLFGRGKQIHNLFTIDFGLSKRYKDPKTGEHIPFREKKPLIGTARYASINTHKGFEQSRRDDLEAIGYMLIYFLKGKLPWQGLKGKNKDEKYNKIKEAKIEIALKNLCDDIPNEFHMYLNYCRKLGFEDKPNYKYLKKMFRELFYINDFEYDNIFDWTLIPLKTIVPSVFNNLPFNTDPNDYNIAINNQNEKRINENGIISGSLTNRDEHIEYNNQLIISQRTRSYKGDENRILQTEPAFITNKNMSEKNKDCIIF